MTAQTQIDNGVSLHGGGMWLAFPATGHFLIAFDKVLRFMGPHWGNKKQSKNYIGGSRWKPLQVHEVSPDQLMNDDDRLNHQDETNDWSVWTNS